MRKKVISMVLCMSMVAGIMAGCGKQSSDKTNESSATDEGGKNT